MRIHHSEGRITLPVEGIKHEKWADCLGIFVDVWCDWNMEEMAGGVRDRQGPGHEGLGGCALGQESFSEVSQGGLVKHPSLPTSFCFEGSGL